MPGDVDSMLAAAKGTLADAKSKFPSKPAAAPAPTKPVTPAAAPKPGLNDEIKAKQDNVKEYADNTPTMHKGGIVEADGPHNLKKGEIVLPAHPDVHNFLMKRGIASLNKKSKR